MSLLRIGTRGSALALAQSTHVKKCLEALSPGVQVELRIIKTTGDRLADASLASIGGKGVFTKELEEALLSKTVDLAVHSLKDLPTELPAGLSVGAILEREDPRDCMVSRFGEQLMELPRGAVIGTSSLRRQAQIRAIKKGIRLEDLRGNLDTRLSRVAAGDFSAVVVAYAGVRRLGRADEVTEVLPFDLILPAPGQGFVAIEIRAEDPETLKWVGQLNHIPGHQAATAERCFLAALGGGCRVPIAAYAREEAGQLILDGRVTSVDGKNDVKGTETGLPANAKKIGHALAQRLLAKGALGILELLVPAQ
jgi:hydroxymethylbilane synthase